MSITRASLVAMDTKHASLVAMDKEHDTGKSLLVAGLCFLAVCVPFGLYATPARKTVLFIGVPPMGNVTTSLNVLSNTGKMDVVLFYVNSELCAHVCCLLAVAEIGMLWYKQQCVDLDDAIFVKSSILRHGGVYTANSEFWSFVCVHHVILLAVVASPLSIHALLLIVLSYTSLLAMLCTPTDDTYEIDVDQCGTMEVYLNKGVKLCTCAVLTLLLVVIDRRINGSTFERVGWGSGAFFSQIVFDICLVVVHKQPGLGLSMSYMARMVYMFSCVLAILWWMACS
jgi:hypothetical protein